MLVLPSPMLRVLRVLALGCHKSRPVAKGIDSASPRILQAKGLPCSRHLALVVMSHCRIKAAKINPPLGP